jgi:hypothetical protein
MIQPADIPTKVTDRYHDTMRPSDAGSTAEDVVQAIRDAAEGPAAWDDEPPTTMPCPACTRCRLCNGSGRVLPYQLRPTPRPPA